MLYAKPLTDRALARHGELLKEAENRRLLNIARANRMGLPDRLLVSFSGFLIFLGRRLQARYRSEPVASTLRTS
jgi:hypothetical protein